jgi:hypothetical protein
VISDITIEVSLADKFSYIDNEGNIIEKEMRYFEPHPDFVDKTGGNYLTGTTTGESGHLGVALLPGKGTSGVNSPDNSIKIILNEKLSQAARAEIYSHEAMGHALMYVRTEDREISGHKFSEDGQMDTNKPLVNMIYRSKMETVKNMLNR